MQISKIDANSADHHNYMQYIRVDRPSKKSIGLAVAMATVGIAMSLASPMKKAENYKESITRYMRHEIVEPERYMQPNVCPDANFESRNYMLSLNQVVDCAQKSGFGGIKLIQIINIASRESGFNAGAKGPGIRSWCNAKGILQEGKCNVNFTFPTDEAYPLQNFDPYACSTFKRYGWSGIYYNPKCAFQWAKAFTDTGITNCKNGLGNFDPEDSGLCFFGTSNGLRARELRRMFSMR